MIKCLKVCRINGGAQGEDIGLLMGDLILSYDGAPVRTNLQLSNAVYSAQRRNKDSATVIVRRDGLLIALEANPRRELGIGCEEVDVADDLSVGSSALGGTRDLTPGQALSDKKKGSSPFRELFVGVIAVALGCLFLYMSTVSAEGSMQALLGGVVFLIAGSLSILAGASRLLDSRSRRGVADLDKAADQAVMAVSKFEKACGKYAEGNYDEARRLFREQVDEKPDSDLGKAAKVQLRFLGANPLPWLPVWPIALIGILFFSNAPRGVYLAPSIPDLYRLGPYWVVGILTLYWLIHSFVWPTVFDASQRFASAVGWLWFIGISTLIIGLLEAAQIIALLDLAQEDVVYIIATGAVVLLVALAAGRAPPLVGLMILIFASLAWAVDTALVLSIVAVSFVSSHVAVEPVFYGWAVVHLIALSSLLRGVGGARALYALSRESFSENASWELVGGKGTGTAGEKKY
ncbi:tol-pal system YbgF family protein [Thiocapsa marina]|uniref:PDZ domain-containing protein n=1 Tax=Thiocapsa marina 5811 TaxID=768671 RepID=F9UHW6_9GAMM|nr:hypothetical protein [Thiocapsa marina]EGV16142.1 hypothetical protein ThimaDRAFT_4519 [Thiocapsa marina 5811]